MTQLVLIRGLPGSGKSTLAKSDFPKHKHFEADQFFINKQTGEYKFDCTKLNAAHADCQRKTEQELRAGHDVVVTNTFTQDWEFDNYFNFAVDTDSSILVIEMKTQYQNIHGVPPEKMEIMKNRWHAWGTFDVPSDTEYQVVE
jgi:predicted kinase